MKNKNSKDQNKREVLCDECGANKVNIKYLNNYNGDFTICRKCFREMKSTKLLVIKKIKGVWKTQDMMIKRMRPLLLKIYQKDYRSGETLADAFLYKEQTELKELQDDLNWVGTEAAKKSRLKRVEPYGV